ncbi:MAG: hypothetical protein AVDCRST_MAG35-1744, partial [uncultured Quadrisphaera sp.]
WRDGGRSLQTSSCAGTCPSTRRSPRCEVGTGCCSSTPAAPRRRQHGSWSTRRSWARRCGGSSTPTRTTTTPSATSRSAPACPSTATTCCPPTSTRTSGPAWLGGGPGSATSPSATGTTSSSPRRPNRCTSGRGSTWAGGPSGSSRSPPGTPTATSSCASPLRRARAADRPPGSSATSWRSRGRRCTGRAASRCAGRPPWLRSWTRSLPTTSWSPGTVAPCPGPSASRSRPSWRRPRTWSGTTTPPAAPSSRRSPHRAAGPTHQERSSWPWSAATRRSRAAPP